MTGLSHNLLMEELETAQAWGTLPDDWFQIDMMWRAAMIAQRRISQVMQAIGDYDEFHKAKVKGGRH
jgi:hypothetical protein